MATVDVLNADFRFPDNKTCIITDYNLLEFRVLTD